MATSTFDVHYANSRTSLVMKANLDRGWRSLQKTCGFNQQARIPYRNDLSIRAQLTVIAQPAGFGPWAQTFPETDVDHGDDDFSYQLRARQLIVKIALLPHQSWRSTPQGRPELYFEELAFLSDGHGHWHDLRAWVVFHEGARCPVKDVRIWAENNLIVPGGQFESNRRHH